MEEVIDSLTFLLLSHDKLIFQIILSWINYSSKNKTRNWIDVISVVTFFQAIVTSRMVIASGQTTVVAFGNGPQALASLMAITLLPCMTTMAAQQV